MNIINEKRKFATAFKDKLAIEAIKEDMTIKELAVRHQVHPSQVTIWKKDFLENAILVFDSKRQEIKDDSKDKTCAPKLVNSK